MHSLSLHVLHLLLYLSLHHSYNPTKALEDKYLKCDSDANYTSGSIYEWNLNLTLTSLAANASQTGFYMTTMGQNTDVVYGLIQCKGDISNRTCQTCANSAILEISQRCHYKKEAAIGYNDCSLQYSDWQFFSTANSVPRLVLYNLQNTRDPVLFNRQLGNLVKNLSSVAASIPSKFAFNSISYTSSVNIYAMVQCTRDLAENTCLSCLEGISSHISQCCNGQEGGRIFSMSCNLRYETYLFFLLPSPPSSPETAPPPSLSSPAPDSRTNSTGHQGGKSTPNLVIIVVIPITVAVVVIAIICSCFLWNKSKREVDVDKNMDLLLELNTIRAATQNFSDAYKLGQGGFGPVYKGKLLDGREIAVKRLSSNSGQGLEELKTEVMLVAKLLHRNLVRLLGFCLEEEEKLLVYEFLSNGSLDKILFDEGKRFSLEWERRYKIIMGTARGLLYLHEDSLLRIIHRDLKASNILLDEHMNPKISDFGLARLFGESQTRGNTKRIAGTYGYMAPEYAKKGHFSTKSDVYSFGILVLEIVMGRKNSSFRDTINLQSYAWQHWSNGTALEILDPTLGNQWPRYEVLKCIQIGLLCVQEAPADRPTMSEIVTMLSSYTITSPAPSRPGFYVSSESFMLGLANDDFRASQSDRLRAVSSQQSVNDVSITELAPR